MMTDEGCDITDVVIKEVNRKYKKDNPDKGNLFKIDGEDGEFDYGFEPRKFTIKEKFMIKFTEEGSETTQQQL